MNRTARDQAVAFLESWLEYRARQLEIPGFVVHVQERDEVVLDRAYGRADVEQNEPMTTGHIFGIASQSKMFTATAVMQLAELGALALDDRAVRYAPWLARHRDERFRGITLRHLLRHGAGMIRDGRNIDFWQLERPFPDETELQRMVLEAELAGETGGKLKYSNLGYALLGQVIQAVSGQSYAEVVAEQIIEPLRLMDTVPEYSPLIVERQATGYTRLLDRQRLVVPKSVPTRAFASVAGWHTTAADLGRFMAAQLPGNTKLLSDTAKTELHRSRRHHWVAPEERGTEYGLGFMVCQLGPRRVIGHSGGFIGHRTAAFLDPATGLSVVVFANAKDAPVMEMMQSVFSIFDYFEQWGTQMASPDRLRFNVRLMDLWSTVQIVATDERIVAVFPEQWLPFLYAEELVRVNHNTLKIAKADDIASAGEMVEFQFRNNGSVETVNYAGSTMRPEQEYLNLIRGSWPARS